MDDDRPVSTVYTVSVASLIIHLSSHYLFAQGGWYHGCLADGRPERITGHKPGTLNEQTCTLGAQVQSNELPCCRICVCMYMGMYVHGRLIFAKLGCKSPPSWGKIAQAWGLRRAEGSLLT